MRERVRLSLGIVAALGSLVWLAPPIAAQPAPAQTAVVASPAIRAEVDALLTEMARATLAGDQAAYLATVHMHPPEFAQEQIAWAKDFEHGVAESFTIAIEGDLTLAGGGERAEPQRVRADIVKRWTMPGARERSVSYPVEFVRDDGAWRYAGEAWERLESPGVVVLYPEGLKTAAEAVADALPAIRDHAHAGFDLEEADIVDRDQVVKLYVDMRHLQESIYLSYTDGLGGWNEPGESIKLLQSRRVNRQQLQIVLAHEYGHVCTFELGPKANDMPWWVLEGVAEVTAEAYSSSARSNNAQVRSWAASGNLVEWHRLADFRGEATNFYGQVYGQGQHMVGYISERFGRDGRNRWLRAMAQGASIEDATREALGLEWADLDNDWRASLN